MVRSVTRMADVSIDPLPWDSNFWGEPAALIRFDGFSVSEARVREVVRSAQDEFDFVQMLVPGADIAHAQSAERAGFLLVDVRCEVALESSDRPPAQDIDGRIRMALDSEIDAVAGLASSRHGNTRFGADPHLDPKKTAEFYRQWMRRDAGLPRWAVAVAEVNGQIAGYVSFGPTVGDTGTIGLIGVAPESTGAGVGSRLVAHATRVLFDAGCSRISVATQAGSVPAMRMYGSCGFAVSRLGYWFHWHRGPSRPEQA